MTKSRNGSILKRAVFALVVLAAVCFASLVLRVGSKSQLALRVVKPASDSVYEKMSGLTSQTGPAPSSAAKPHVVRHGPSSEDDSIEYTPLNRTVIAVSEEELKAKKRLGSEHHYDAFQRPQLRQDGGVPLREWKRTSESFGDFKQNNDKDSTEWPEVTAGLPKDKSSSSSDNNHEKKDENFSVDSKHDKTTEADVAVELKDGKNPWTQVIGLQTGRKYKVTSRAAQQIDHYRHGTGLMMNLHITHHGGTTFCHAIGRAPNANGTAPAFACNVPNAEDHVDISTYPSHKKRPWAKNETDKNIPIVRQYFHMIAWEFRRAPGTPIASADLEHPDLLSVITMRDPMSRMLARGGYTNKQYPGFLQGDFSTDTLWRFANDSHYDNFALRVLAGNGCCDGENTSKEHLDNAKALVERFAIVLDIECLDEGMKAIGDLLNLTLHPTRPAKVHLSPEERINNTDVFEYLKRKNHYDIELYEWSKTRSLIDCAAVRQP